MRRMCVVQHRPARSSGPHCALAPERAEMNKTARRAGLALSLAVASIPGFAGAPEPFEGRAYIRPAQAPFPADNPPNAARIALGKALFFDPRLSGSNWISCASCHNPGLGW